jgi:hypothetical protein
VDLYVSNYRGDNALYHNNGDATLTDIAKQAGVTGTGHGFAAWFFDYDNDGPPPGRQIRFGGCIAGRRRNRSETRDVSSFSNPKLFTPGTPDSARIFCRLPVRMVVSGNGRV